MTESRLAAEAGEYQYALELLMPVVERSEDPELTLRAAQLAAAVNDWETAARAAERWHEIDPDALDALQFAVIAALRGNDRERAVALLHDRLVGRPGAGDQRWNHAVTLLGLAPSILVAGQSLEDLLEKTGPHVPGFSDFQRSRLLWQFEEFDNGYQLAYRAWQDSGEVEHAIWAARLAEATGETEQAVEIWRAAVEIEPNRREARLGLAELLRETGHIEESLVVLEEMEGDLETLYNIALLRQELGQSARAGAAWQRLALLDPVHDPERHAWLTGVLAELLEMNDHALAWYQRVEGELAPRAALRSALLLARLDQLDEAREMLAGVRETGGPDLTEQAWLIEGQVLGEHDRHDEALRVLSRALTEMPGSDALLYARAMAAVQADELELAEQDLRTIIQNDPENAAALNALGYTLSDRTDRQREAYRLIETALALDPHNPAILDSMGWVLYRLGRAEEGLPYLERAARAEPHPEIVAHLIEVLIATGREDEARATVLASRDQFAGDPVYDETLQRLGLE
ncbi:MAG: tetratricopeptide repeat protein [Wenzhouxiangellaceae bacterium]